jgi:hypothetical protein
MLETSLNMRINQIEVVTGRPTKALMYGPNETEVVSLNGYYELPETLGEALIVESLMAVSPPSPDQ